MYPRVCVIGPLVGAHPGRVNTQGQVLSALLADAGYDVTTASSALNRYWRLVDIVSTLIRRRSKTDVVILEVYSGPSFIVADVASCLGKRFGLQLVLWLHGGALPEFMARYPKWAGRVLSRADTIIAPSSYLARAVASYGFQARVIPNSVKLSDYSYRHRERVKPRLFWMRSFHSVWNPLMAIRVLARLREIVPEATLAMAGQDKGLKSEALRLARDLGLEGAVRFPGFLDKAMKAQEGNTADIYINTNRIDNMPVAVIEACAMGLPVVTTAVGGIKDLLIDGETALLVPDNDEESMVQAIMRVLFEPSLAGQLSANGRRLAERSSWNTVRPQWERVFSDLTRHVLKHHTLHRNKCAKQAT